MVLAASNLTPFGGVPADVGLLVDPAERGRGLGRQVGAVAAQVAVDRHGIARWRAVVGNHGSRRIAERLGFEPDCLQLAVVPVDGLA